MGIINENDLPQPGDELPQVESSESTTENTQSDDKEASPIVEPVKVHKGEVVGKSPLHVMPDGQLSAEEPHIILPGTDSATYKARVIDRINAMPEKEIEKLFSTDWGVDLVMGEELSLKNNDFDSALDREGSIWDHGIKHENHRIGIGRYAPKSAGGQEISGLMAVARLSASQNIGRPVTVPLPHTGIWVTLRPAQNIDLMNMEARVSSLKAAFGRQTRGRVFSQSDVYLKMTVVDFILDHVEATTAPSGDKIDLKELIKITDIPVLINAMGCANHPSGQYYAQPCTARPGECHYVARGKVNLPDMLYVDNSAFTELQRKHLLSPSRKITKVEELEAYQSEFKTLGFESFIYKDSLKIELQVPTIADYERAGYAWAEELERAYEAIFGRGVNLEQRSEYVNQQAELGALRQYSHWVKRIVFLDPNGEEGDWIQKRDELVRNIERMTDDPDFSKAYYTNVIGFINQVTMAVTAVPNFVCPSCGSIQPTDEGRFKHLIPVDMAQAFFILARLRVLTATSTSNI